MTNSINNNGKNSRNDDDVVLARLSGETASRIMRALEKDAGLRFHLVQQNDDHDPVIEIIKDD